MSVRINRVYTRSGDKGDTAVVGGERVSKDSARITALGDIDELNALLGVVKEELSSALMTLRGIIESVQQQLFDLGAEIATQEDYEGMWHVETRHVEYLESLCDSFGEDLAELNSFILPGGSKVAAQIHAARAVCRRAERSVVTLCKEAEMNPLVLVYLNRMSDMLFNLSRFVLKEENKEPLLWLKEKDRP